jgi:hyperosmotically inducible protein
LLVVSATAFAQPSDFALLDRNGDGYLSRLEAAGVPEIAKRFAQFDTDQDRRLSPAEYAAARDDNDKRALRDAALTARVKAALFAERGIPSTAISIETYEGQVLLSGFVPAADMASRAGRVTAGVNGVRSVHNNLLVKQK